MSGFDKNVVEAIIEIPRGSSNKYEFDKEKNVLNLIDVYFLQCSIPQTMALYLKH